MGIRAPLYVSQNDGTLISADYAARYPVLTFGSGPTNSMRGAAFLTGLQDAIVMDVGGTTTDIGALVHGFPRESSIAVDIGGVRTNFRMPDILSMGLGGGTRIRLDGPGGSIRVGPGFRGLSVARGGLHLRRLDAHRERYRRQGRLCELRRRVPRAAISSRGVMQEILAQFRRMFEDGIDRMKTAAADVPVVLVGGGSVLVEKDLKGASRGRATGACSGGERRRRRHRAGRRGG